MKIKLLALPIITSLLVLGILSACSKTAAPNNITDGEQFAKNTGIIIKMNPDNQSLTQDELNKQCEEGSQNLAKLLNMKPEVFTQNCIKGVEEATTTPPKPEKLIEINKFNTAVTESLFESVVKKSSQ